MTSMMRRAARRGRATTRMALATLALAGPLVIAPLSARAQAPVPPRLVLGELYRDARRDSPRVAAARAVVRAAEARVSSTRLPPDPRLQLGFMNYSLPKLRPMDPLGMTQLQLMQMVPTAGKLGLSGRAAAARASAAAARAGDVEWEVRAQAAMVFYELYETEQGLAVARQTLRLLRDAAETAESMYRVGQGRQADVLRAQVEIARMSEDTIRVRAMRIAAAARLDALLDRAPGDDRRLPSPVLPAFPATVPPLDSVLRLARDSRPMLTAGAREVDAARAEERLARREIWPDLEVGVQYGQRAGEMGPERMGSLMVGASVPLYARGRQLRMREEAAAMRQMAAADLAAMAADTRGRIGTAYADLERARRLAALYRTTVIPQAEAAASSALASYRVGGVDFMTLLDDRMTVNRYRTELYALEADEGKAWAELEMLGGRELLDPDTLARVTADGGAR
jgi:outer membrane protein, heavy metal efflux system